MSKLCHCKKKKNKLWLWNKKLLSVMSICLNRDQNSYPLFG